MEYLILFLRIDHRKASWTYLADVDASSWNVIATKRSSFSPATLSREIMEITVIPGNQYRRRVAQMFLLRAFNGGSYARSS